MESGPHDRRIMVTVENNYFTVWTIMNHKKHIVDFFLPLVKIKRRFFWEPPRRSVVIRPDIPRARCTFLCFNVIQHIQQMPYLDFCVYCFFPGISPSVTQRVFQTTTWFWIQRSQILPTRQDKYETNGTFCLVYPLKWTTNDQRSNKINKQIFSRYCIISWMVRSLLLLI